MDCLWCIAYAWWIYTKAQMKGMMTMADNKSKSLVKAAADDQKHLGFNVNDLEFKAESLTISTQAEYEEAVRFGIELNDKIKSVEDFFEPMRIATYDAYQAVLKRKKQLIEPLKHAADIVVGSVSFYNSEQLRIQRQLEQKMRAAAQAEVDKKMQEASDAFDAGDEQAAATAMAEAEVMDSMTFVAPAASAVKKVKGATTKTDYEIVSIDSSKVPAFFMGNEIRPVDQKAVLKLIRATNGKLTIPGIVFKEVVKTALRRSARK